MVDLSTLAVIGPALVHWIEVIAPSPTLGFLAGRGDSVDGRVHLLRRPFDIRSVWKLVDTAIVHRRLADSIELRDNGLHFAFAHIPVRLEPCDMPARLEHLHYVDLFSPPGSGRLLAALRST